MNTKKKIDSLFEKEKNSTETPIFNENEIRNILGGKRALPFKNVQKKVSIMKISMLAVSVFAVIATSGILFNNSTDEKKIFKKVVDEKIYDDAPYSTHVKGDLNAVKMIELTPEELRQFGIEITKDGIVYCSIYKSQSEITKLLKKLTPNGLIESSKTGVSTTGMRFFPNEKVPLKMVLFSPKMISDDLGMRRMTWYDDEDIAPEISKKWEQERKNKSTGKYHSEKRMNEYRDQIASLAEQKFNNTNNLIPILIRTGKTYSAEDKKESRWRPNCIFWYDATPQFIAALPERFKNSLKIENKAVEALALKTEDAIEKVEPLPSPQQVLKELQKKESKMEPQEILISDKEKRETGDTYFDVWRSAAGAITSSTLFPNPVRDQIATVKFTLKEDRNILITIHDIYGRRIAELSKSTAFKSGEHLQEILLKDVQPGIYLIAIQTDKGEQAVQRVIVE